MNKLWLKKGRDYRGHGVFAKKGELLKVDDAKRDALLATGYFALVSSETNDKTPSTPLDDNETGNQTLSIAYIEGLKKEEIIALAKEHSIDIGKCKNNAERVSKIIGALGLVNFSDLGIEE